MTALRLEDFGHGAEPAPVADRMHPPADGFDQGYKAGWEDATARISEENGQIGETLADGLRAVMQTREEVTRDVLDALEPLLRDLFDKVLPHGARRSFVPILVQEAERAIEDASNLSILVAPEDVAALEALIERSERLHGVVTVKGEAALSLSQALLQWRGGERRVDLEAVLSDLDAALDAFLLTTPNPSLKPEAANG
jgi:flagellar assembly protein FliH